MNRTILRRALIPLILTHAFLSVPLAGSLPSGSPEKAGFSRERFDRIAPFMQKYVDEGKVAGLITMVARRGTLVHFETYGVVDVETKQPMERDTIFRIYSMTKPVTSVALLVLYEEGRFALRDPVGKFIPELANLKVYAGGPKESPQIVDPERPITILDLMTHTAGLTYGLFSNTPVDELYKEVDPISRGGTLEGMIGKLAGLPLLHHPGGPWHYSVATDVLGRLVEVISGQRFDVFLAERLFGPLKMKDTGFYVSEGQRHRFASMHFVTEKGDLIRDDTAWTKEFDNPPSFLSGGGGLVSTATDYLRFTTMLLNGGELDGVRILGRKTVTLMATNHLPDALVPISFETWRMEGYGFGLGVAVRVDPAASAELGSVGMYSWGGFANTYFWIDPEEELIAILMSQFTPFGHYPLRARFQTLVYQALED